MLYAVKFYERKYSDRERGFLREPDPFNNGNHVYGTIPMYFEKEVAIKAIKDAEKAYLYKADLIGEDGSVETFNALKKNEPKKLSFGRFRL